MYIEDDELVYTRGKSNPGVGIEEPLVQKSHPSLPEQDDDMVYEEYEPELEVENELDETDGEHEDIRRGLNMSYGNPKGK